MNWIVPLLIYEIILLMVIIWYTRTDIISPAFITLLVFTLSTLCVVYNIDYWDVHFSIEAFSLISLGLTVVALVEMIVQSSIKRSTAWVGYRTGVQTEKEMDISSVTYFAFLAIAFLMLVYLILDIYRVGGGGIASISTLKSDEELNLSVLGKICKRVCALYAYPPLYIFFHNVIFARQKIKGNLRYLIPAIFTCISTIFAGGRSGILYVISAGVVYAIVFDKFRNGWYRIDIKKYIRPILTVCILFLVAFFGTRSIVKGKSYTTTFMEYITYYLGSPVHLLSKIMENPSSAFPTKYTVPGVNVFTSFYEELYNLGLFSQNVQINQTGFTYIGGDFIGGGNTYTMFGPLYNDFGFIGALVFVAIFYGIIDWIYYRHIKYARNLEHGKSTLFLYGYFVYMVYMNFYVPTVIYLKFSKLIEVLIMIIILKLLAKVKLVVGRG